MTTMTILAEETAHKLPLNLNPYAFGGIALVIFILALLFVLSLNRGDR
jgi:hypothetical protein